MDIRAAVPAALRHHAETNDKLWAHLVSLVISPPVVWGIWAFLIALSATPSRIAALVYAAIFTFMVCILPILFVACMVKLGRIGDLHMRESRERYIPYLIAIIGGILTEIIFLQSGAHPVLLIVTLVSIVELTLMLLGTFFIHISLHAMAMSSIISATAILFGFSQSLMLMPVILAVVLARLVLGRHTPLQIMAGILIGALTPFAVIATLPLVM